MSSLAQSSVDQWKKWRGRSSGFRWFQFRVCSKLHHHYPHHLNRHSAMCCVWGVGDPAFKVQWISGICWCGKLRIRKKRMLFKKAPVHVIGDSMVRKTPDFVRRKLECTYKFLEVKEMEDKFYGRDGVYFNYVENEKLGR
ncbi:uncharacterized protein LOC135100539 isoform X1 [Scylla paramamosain]|uniref:uncharacterized protein LOC135100539 isoform X1 n=1 Tax=Scylla paramamosain TaxID=85552 RepID=UPI003082EB86